MDLRIDANEAWSPAEVVERVRPLLPFRPSALEQPVPHAEVDALAELRPRLGVPVMLDESLCGYPDATRPSSGGTADLFNVRLSKCGGIIPTRSGSSAWLSGSGIGVQLGCHPGETGLLSAAGRHVATHRGGCVTSKVHTTATSWPKTSRSRTSPSAAAAGLRRSRGRAWGSTVDPRGAGRMTVTTPGDPL